MTILVSWWRFLNVSYKNKKSERGCLERFALHMTLFMQKIQEQQALFIEYNLWWGGQSLKNDL